MFKKTKHTFFFLNHEKYIKVYYFWVTGASACVLQKYNDDNANKCAGARE